MFFKVFWLFSLFWTSGLCGYEKPIPERENHNLCFKQPYLLNECNWCVCTVAKRYTCTARICAAVDMQNHFKQNTLPLNIGMEGHGAWRSKTERICEPNIRYTKGDVVCICTEEGSWPSPVCHDLFSQLYSVKLTGLAVPNNQTKCEPGNLYVIGCNACMCPDSGYIDPELCSNKECTNNDPALLANKGEDVIMNVTRRSMTEYPSIFLECNPDQHYKLGCRSCVCNNDNRLICSQCFSEKQLTKSSIPCYGHHHYIFANDCNVCYCGDGNLAFCTVKKCISKKVGIALEKKYFGQDVLSINYADPPDRDEHCTPGTVFKRGCNTCYCTSDNGNIFLYCSVAKDCDKENPLKSITSTCVPNTYYEQACLICHCTEVEDDIWRNCVVKPECLNRKPSLKSMNDDRDFKIENKGDVLK